VATARGHGVASKMLVIFASSPTTYADPHSPLSHRLRQVQHHIAAWLDQRRDQPLTVVSACAGQGHDLVDRPGHPPGRQPASGHG
jgi:hypothetical protein